MITSSRFSAFRDEVPLVKVEPLIVAEVSADSAPQGGGYRHPVRYVRPRFDLAPEDHNGATGVTPSRPMGPMARMCGRCRRFRCRQVARKDVVERNVSGW